VSLKDAVREKMKAALKEGDKQRLGVLRMVLSELKVAQASGKQYDEMDVIRSYAKKLRKAAAQYDELNLPDKGEECRAELAIVEEFLPKQMARQEVEALVEELIAERGYGPRDIGKVMREIMTAHKDTVDGHLVQQVVKEKLSAQP